MSRSGPVFDHKPSRPVRGEMLLDDATKRRINRSRLRRVGAVCAVVAIVGSLIAVYLSPILRVHDVNVDGASPATAQEIDGLIDLDGESMLTSSFSDVQQQVSAIPLVKSVRIERQWPQTLKVIVTERAAWGIWMLGETPYTIDDEGVVLAGVPAPEGVPVIRVPASEGLLIGGDRVDTDAISLTREMLAQVPARFGMGLPVIEWSAAAGLTLTTDAGYHVVIGDSENWDYKLAVWQQIEAQIGRDAMIGQVLDLRFGDRAALAAIATPAPSTAPTSAPEVSQ